MSDFNRFQNKFVDVYLENLFIKLIQILLIFKNNILIFLKKES